LRNDHPSPCFGIRKLPTCL